MAGRPGRPRKSEAGLVLKPPAQPGAFRMRKAERGKTLLRPSNYLMLKYFSGTCTSVAFM